MKNVLRLAVTIISALATFYFTFWVGGALLSAVGLPFLLSSCSQCSLQPL